MSVTVPTAIVEAVRAAVPGELVVDGLDKETPASRYAVVTPDNGLFSRDNLDSLPDDVLFRWSVMSVGPTRGDASFLAREITDYLLHNRIVVDGWKCSMPAHVNTREPVRDEAITARAVMYSIDQFTMQAHRV